MVLKDCILLGSPGHRLVSYAIATTIMGSENGPVEFVTAKMFYP
jgi:hypothetical protein